MTKKAMGWLAALTACAGINLAVAADLPKTYEDRGTAGPWHLRYYGNIQYALDHGARCTAHQIANGAVIEATLDPERPKDPNAVQLFVAFADANDGASIETDEGVPLLKSPDRIYPQRHGVAGGYNASDIKGSQFFVTFYLGRLVRGRYQFPIGPFSSVNAFLHGPGCAFVQQVEPPISRARWDAVTAGDNCDDLDTLLGAAHDSETSYTDARDYTWTHGLGKGPVTVTCDLKGRVTEKSGGPAAPEPKASATVAGTMTKSPAAQQPPPGAQARLSDQTVLCSVEHDFELRQQDMARPFPTHRVGPSCFYLTDSAAFAVLDASKPSRVKVKLTSGDHAGAVAWTDAAVAR